VIGATLLPFEGAFYYSAEKDSCALAVNAWIQTSGAFDGIMRSRTPGVDPAQRRAAVRQARRRQSDDASNAPLVRIHALTASACVLSRGIVERALER